jgi:iron(III) transport system substrate-binding protein
MDPKVLAEAFPSPSLAGVALHEIRRDKDGNLLPPRWVGVCLSAFGIVYNPDVYRTLGLEEPKTWSDLARPELANLVALADPARSGSAAVAYLMVIQRAMQDAEDELFKARPELKKLNPKILAELAAKGTVHAAFDKAEEDRMDDAQKQARAALRKEMLARANDYELYAQTLSRGWKKGMSDLLLIAANARYFTDSANLVPKDVSTGDAAAGMAIDFYGRTFEEIVGSNRVKYISPPAATAITPDPVAILRGVSGQRKVLANRFIEFLLTKEGQVLWIKKPGMPGGPMERGLRRPPVRQDVYGDRSEWTDDVNPFEEAGGFNQRAEWGTLFSDVRPVWAAAWIDTREDLKRAYAKIRALPDPQLRDVLLKKLADLPVQLQDVAENRMEGFGMAGEQPHGLGRQIP